MQTAREFLRLTSVLMILLAKCESRVQLGILPKTSPDLDQLNTTGIKFGKRWPSLLIPVVLDETLSKEIRKLALQATGVIQYNTCIGFVRPGSRDKFRLVIKNPDGNTECSSFLGYSGAKNQPLQLSDRCNNKGIILRQLVHALGVFDENVENGFLKPSPREYALIRSMYKCPEESIGGNIIELPSDKTKHQTTKDSSGSRLLDKMMMTDESRKSVAIAVPHSTGINEDKFKKSAMKKNKNKVSMVELDPLLKIQPRKNAIKEISGFTKIDDMKFPPQRDTDERGRATVLPWPKGVIFYRLDSSLSRTVRQKVVEAMSDFHKHTCIRFKRIRKRNRRSARNYLVLWNNRSLINTECNSYVGFRNLRNQPIQLSDGCNSKGIILHELMHSLGFVHEHIRDDRDKFIQIFYENIQPEQLKSFAKFTKYDGEPENHYGETYNYDSILHYSPLEFSNNGRAVIVPLNNPKAQGTAKNIGQRNGLSEGDVNKVNRKYKCFGRMQNINTAIPQQKLEKPLVKFLLSPKISTSFDTT